MSYVYNTIHHTVKTASWNVRKAAGLGLGLGLAVYFYVNMIHELNNISLIILKYKQLKYHYNQNITKTMSMQLKYIFTTDALIVSYQIYMFRLQMNHKLSIETCTCSKSLVVFHIVCSF